MRPQLGPLVLINDPLKQRAKNGGVHLRPILLGRLHQQPAQVVGDVGHEVVIEQGAVEVADGPHAKDAAAAHLVEQLLQHGAQLAVIAAARLHNLGEQVVGQQPHVLGKQGKQQPDEEVGQLFVAKTAVAQQVAVFFHLVGHVEQGIGRGFGDVLPGARWLEPLWLKEGPGELLHAVAAEDVVQGEAVLLDGVVVEVGVDDDGADVAGDEQGRIFQRFAVKLELLVRFV